MQHTVKTITILSILFAAFTLSAEAQVCTPVVTNLVSWYSGDNNTLDSRSRNNGTLGASSQFAAGKVGQAFQTIQTSGSTITVPDSASLDFTNALTIEMWVSSSVVGSNGAFLACKGNCGSFGDQPYSLVYNEGGREVIFRVGNSSTFDSLASSPLTLNTFTHLAATYDGSMMRIYINGILNNSKSTTIGTLVNSSNPFVIGGSTGSGNAVGIYDEVSLYNRALTSAEIAAIANAGNGGKCKPTATVAPSGQVAWLAGDGDARDIAGTSDGTLQSGATFAVGKVGQSFSFDGNDDSIQLPLNQSFQNFTLESWVKPNSAVNDPINQELILGQAGFGSQMAVVPGTNGGMRVKIQYRDTINSFAQVISTTDIPLNDWSHLVGTYDGTTLKLYINGVLNAQLNPTNTTVQICNTPYFIGGFQSVTDCNAITSPPFQFFNGLIDETSVYNRALTDAEVQSIFNAGIAGKLKDNSTPAGANVSVSTRSDGTITFPNVSTAGITQQIPLDLSVLPTLPAGLTATGLTYDIATSATFTGSPQVCFNLPSFTESAAFSNLRILHLENNIWQNRTDLASINFATKTVCTNGLPFLSPFAVVSVVSTAANAAISGQIRTANGNGIRNAVIRLLNIATGETRIAQTGSFGRYSFADLAVGQTYILSVEAKRYQFAEPTRMINLAENVNDADFVSEDK